LPPPLLEKVTQPSKYKKMADVAAPPTTSASSGPMDVVPTNAPGLETSAPEPVVDEHTSETLYIQNLNEKIKPDGKYCLSFADSNLK